MTDQDVRHFLAKVCGVLNKHEVDYIVIGGAAVNYYGHNRPSTIERLDASMKADLDFWYRPTINNFSKIIKALTELGLDTSELKEIIFDPKRTFLKIPHEEFQTDFLPVMEGLGSYKGCKENAEIVEIDGVPVFILSYEDLIANKRAINRGVDKQDIEALERIRKKKLKGPKRS